MNCIVERLLNATLGEGSAAGVSMSPMPSPSQSDIGKQSEDAVTSMSLQIIKWILATFWNYIEPENLLLQLGQ